MGKNKLLVVFRQGFTDFADVGSKFAGVVDKIYNNCSWKIDNNFLIIETENNAKTYYPFISIVRFADITHEENN